MTSMLNALTIDVEDYFQVSAFEKDVPRSEWDLYETRVEKNTHRLLDLLNRHNVRATFFVLGWVARRYPRLVREIHALGHEVGSHGYWHRLIYDQSPREFRRDLVQSRDVLADVLGTAVTAYRAPSFSVTKRSLWALDILAQEGFTIDSSVVPTRHDRYGIPGAERSIHRIETASGPLWECPPPVVKVARFALPVGGGGYFRLYPWSWTRHFLSKIHRNGAEPFVFYVHPWEVDPRQPRLPAGSRIARFRHRVNLSTTEAKLDLLLGEFPFGPLSEVVRRTRSDLERRIVAPRSSLTEAMLQT